MFKKLKDKLAEEVKSSPQRIQQFAQAAQAAVTSASSSISDITNSDLFSIGDNDAQNSRATNKLRHSPDSQPNAYEDSPLVKTTDATESMHDAMENPRQRRLSNSSFASDISFRLPSYETPSMYHLQSDMEVSASEAEERGFSNTNVSLERVTKEQLYAAYRRTQERYTKYRTQYGDLARHYKLLEKENAKARSVLVETQDKALRRISELREQCALEQSAKAHLEKSLRIDLEERNMKIDALNTKLQILQNNTNVNNIDSAKEDKRLSEGDCEVQLINLTNEIKPQTEEFSTTEITNLSIKLEKMEQLLNKYKESLKLSKDKNSQMTSELLIMSNELKNKNEEIDKLKDFVKQLDEAKVKINELNAKNEDLQNKINAYDFSKTKEVSTLEIDLQRAKDEIEELKSKVAVFSKREEDYAISLAENKLSIHKELENKESEIKSLKETLSSSKNEIQSLKIIIDDYKSKLAILEEEQTKFSNANNDVNMAKCKITDLEFSLQDITKKYTQLEHIKAKLDEDNKCLQLQLNQETAEKLAMIDRNDYLEKRNKQLTEDNTKKSSYISTLENELLVFKKDKTSDNFETIANQRNEILKELSMWKTKYEKLEFEIQEERVELVKLQSEIEKLIVNHELIQSQNTDFRTVISELKAENVMLQDQLSHYKKIKNTCKKLASRINELQQFVKLTSDEATLLKKSNYETILSFNEQINEAFNQLINTVQYITTNNNELSLINTSLKNELLLASEQYAAALSNLNEIQNENEIIKSTNHNLETENVSLNENNIYLKKQYEAVVQDLENMKHENEIFNSKRKESEIKLNSMQLELESKNSNQADLIEQLKLLQNEKEELLQTISSVEYNNSSLQTQLQKLNHDYNKNIEELVTSKKKINKDSIEKEEELSNKVNIINQLEDKVKMLSNEKVYLEKQAQNIACNVKEFESEIKEVRISHAALENENNRLNILIEQLEQNENLQREQETKGTQTIFTIENKSLLENISTLEVSEQNISAENQILLLTSGREINAVVSTPENELSNKYILLENDYDILREENRRLRSDIEGLQSYLSKISKENTMLNDKLRELIATCEHSTENDATNDFTSLNSEIVSNREKIENLLRENTLLIEENLELKDQLQAQSYTKLMDNSFCSDKENKKEMCDFNERCNNLLQINSKLEQKLLDTEHLNTNMQQLQEKNEKLRSSNEKLERRLDEALVSLRHLHSLQENTELEYLRNILYEYLTGSGTHSVTLAKVLSAIVKFDDTQTQLVLQKEKERQGFLRQLGLI